MTELKQSWWQLTINVEDATLEHGDGIEAQRRWCRSIERLLDKADVRAATVTLEPIETPEDWRDDD